jgi:hypothetical protein
VNVVVLSYGDIAKKYDWSRVLREAAGSHIPLPPAKRGTHSRMLLLLLLAAARSMLTGPYAVSKSGTRVQLSTGAVLA